MFSFLLASSLYITLVLLAADESQKFFSAWFRLIGGISIISVYVSIGVGFVYLYTAILMTIEMLYPWYPSLKPGILFDLTTLTMKDTVFHPNVLGNSRGYTQTLATYGLTWIWLTLAACFVTSVMSVVVYLVIQATVSQNKTQDAI